MTRAGAAVALSLVVVGIIPRQAAGPAIETLRLDHGTVVFRQTTTASPPAAFVGGEVWHAVPPAASRAAAVRAIDPVTGAQRALFELPSAAGQRPEITSVLPFVNGDAAAVVARVPGERKHVVFVRDLGRGTLERVYERADEQGLVVEVLDWSLANQIFVYEYRRGPVTRWLGRIVAITLFPREVVQLSDRHRITGVPTVDSSGRRVAFVSGPDDTIGQPYHVELLDLPAATKRTLFERTGTRVIVYNGEPTMTATRARWTADDRAVVIVDNDHSVDMPPMLMQIPMAPPATPISRRLESRGEALDVRLAGDDTAYVLVRETGGRHLVVELDAKSGVQRTVLSRQRPIELVGIIR